MLHKSVHPHFGSKFTSERRAMAGLPKADDLAAELGVEDLYEFLGVRSDSTDKEVGYNKTFHAA